MIKKLSLIVIVTLLLGFYNACGRSGFKAAQLSQSFSSYSNSTEIITSFSVPESVLSLTVPISDFSIEKQSNTSYFYIFSESSTPPQVNELSWSASPPAQYTFGSPGNKTLYAWVKDASGKIYKNRYVNILISISDIIPPIVNSFLVPATSVTVEIPIQSFTASDDKEVRGYIITESSDRPAINDSRWKNVSPVSYNISTFQSKTGSGIFTLYAWAKDSSDNISQSLSAIIDLQIDSNRQRAELSPPTLYTFDVPASNGGLVMSIYSLVGYDDTGITGFIITESNSIPLLSDSRWSTEAQTQYSFSTPGYKKIYAWAKDASGKISASKSAYTYIYTDTVSNPLVLILVRDYLYNDGAFALTLAQYVSALSTRGYANPQIISTAKLNSNNLRQMLISARANTQRKFSGAILIGDISQANYIHPNDFNGATAVFPSDAALTTLDSTIDYSTANGTFSNIRDDIAPKIWLGRIDFSRNSLYGNELDTTKSYLAKLAHDDVSKLSSPLIGKALLYVEKDWVDSSIVPFLPGFAKAGQNYPNLTQSSYLDAIKQPYEFLHVMVHSNSHGHYFSQFLLQASNKFLVETRLINLFACSAVLPGSSSLLEPYMLSGSRGGIALVGSTKAGSMAYGEDTFYADLKNGKNIGEAFVNWQSGHLADDLSKRWHLGMSINGDPTVKPTY